MKVKKATKRLSRVETLLSGVLNGYATDIAEVREPLEAATAAVQRARSAIDSNQSGSNRQATATSGRTAPRAHRPTAEGGKRTSRAAKNRFTSAKRKGIRPATASHGESSQPKKRISAEGLKRIAEANKRRWANQRAARNAQTAAAQRKPSATKKTSPARRGAAKKVPAETATTQTQMPVSANA